VFLFGFSYYGVLKIRRSVPSIRGTCFVLSRIFGDVLYQFSYKPGFIAKSRRLKEDQWLRSNMEGGRKL